MIFQHIQDTQQVFIGYQLCHRHCSMQSRHSSDQKINTPVFISLPTGDNPGTPVTSSAALHCPLHSARLQTKVLHRKKEKKIYLLFDYKNKNSPSPKSQNCNQFYVIKEQEKQTWEKTSSLLNFENSAKPLRLRSGLNNYLKNPKLLNTQYEQ